MTAAAEAERRGDARGALDLIEQGLLDADGNLFWRSDRIIRLTQLASFGPLLPRWATSRWLLEQALQELRRDPRTKYADRDWVDRQRALYDLGGLASYLRRVPLHVFADGDRIDEWARAPMGGYRFVERGSAVTAWENLGSGERIETANIGSAAMLLLGECAIGRLVPIDSGRMFETVPLRVPGEVARAVAADPADWLQPVRAAIGAGERFETGGCRFGFLTDVPRVASVFTVYDDLELLDRYPERAEKLLACVREALDEEPSTHRGSVDVWACIGAELLHPGVLSALADRLRPEDSELYARLAQALAEPAATLARLLAREARDVA